MTLPSKASIANFKSFLQEQKRIARLANDARPKKLENKTALVDLGRAAPCEHWIWFSKIDMQIIQKYDGAACRLVNKLIPIKEEEICSLIS